MDAVAYLAAKSHVRKARTKLRSMIEEARLAGLIQTESRVAYNLPSLWGIYVFSIPVTIIGIWLHPLEYYSDLQGVEVAWLFFPFFTMLGYLYSLISPIYHMAIFSPDRINIIERKRSGPSECKTMRWRDITVNVFFGESLDVSLTDGTLRIHQNDYINTVLVWYFLQKYAPEKIPEDSRIRRMAKAAPLWCDKHPQTWP